MQNCGIKICSLQIKGVNLQRVPKQEHDQRETPNQWTKSEFENFNKLFIN